MKIGKLGIIIVVAVIIVAGTVGLSMYNNGKTYGELQGKAQELGITQYEKDAKFVSRSILDEMSGVILDKEEQIKNEMPILEDFIVDESISIDESQYENIGQEYDYKLGEVISYIEENVVAVLETDELNPPVKEDTSLMAEYEAIQSEYTNLEAIDITQLNSYEAIDLFVEVKALQSKVDKYTITNTSLPSYYPKEVTDIGVFDQNGGQEVYFLMDDECAEGYQTGNYPCFSETHDAVGTFINLGGDYNNFEDPNNCDALSQMYNWEGEKRFADSVVKQDLYCDDSVKK